MSELERLRQLLLAPEQGELQQQRAAIDALQKAQTDLPDRLPEMLDQVESGARRDALHRVLAPVVAASLADAVRRDRRSIVDALFPIIGPSIRKAIAEALRAFAADLNRALDHSLTPRGLRWRLESWRTGVPFSQVVMKHTLRYRIDHLFLIERESGLLLHRYTAPELPDLDADAIAGMLTAIGDFVRDSVQSDQDTESGLASATIGEHLLQVYEGPRAVLACFIQGVPPSELSAHLRTALEDLHRDQDAAGEAFDWELAASQLLGIDAMSQLSRSDPQVARPPRWPMILLLLLLLGLLGAFGYQRWQRADTGQRLRAAVTAMPGWQLLALDFDGVWKLKLLRDPDSEPSAELAYMVDLPGDQIEIEEQAFLALDEPLVAARARRLLQPADGTELRFQQGRLQVSGSAERSWVRRLQQLGPWLPGVASIDIQGLTTTPDAADLARLKALQADIATRPIPFRRGRSQLEPLALPAAQALAGVLRELMDLARSNEIRAIIRLRGWSDDGGSDKLNADLRAARAQALQEVLVSQGIPPEVLVLESDDQGLGTPAATAEVQLDPAP
ncbi:MAG: hypothetical protein AB7E72_05375 [Lysobacterales bacterium]